MQYVGRKGPCWDAGGMSEIITLGGKDPETSVLNFKSNIKLCLKISGTALS